MVTSQIPVDRWRDMIGIPVAVVLVCFAVYRLWLRHFENFAALGEFLLAGTSVS